MDTSLHMIHEALSWVNPRSFTWVGPDPPHHFSAAIVPAALPHVLGALQTQTNLTRLTLTHVKFPDNGDILSLPRFPSLKTLNLSQVIFLHPEIIAQFVVTAGSQLEQVHLIDAYQHSIWGPRLREDDDGIVTVSASQKEAASNELLSRIRRIVVCQGKFERIIGGDRVMRDSILI
ncbi:hypothetical protein AN958_11100 [Leucoagaricus sp. SymC.cos]|nr:hypothetical protein AN958_11100 [Leucoagaricus sp. SymC.cos]